MKGNVTEKNLESEQDRSDQLPSHGFWYDWNTVEKDVKLQAIHPGSLALLPYVFGAW